MPGWQVTQIRLGVHRHLATEALWALMHINEIGYAIPRQKHWFATPPFNRFTKMSPVVKVVSKTVKN